MRDRMAIEEESRKTGLIFGNQTVRPSLGTLIKGMRCQMIFSNYYYYYYYLSTYMYMEEALSNL